ncbi:MAG: hypothetical protein ABIP41_00195 [Croceibacterium sp.]
MKPFGTAAAILLGIVALAHLYRLIRPFDVAVGGQSVPQWVSVIGVIVAGGISLMLWRESRTAP